MFLAASVLTIGGALTLQATPPEPAGAKEPPPPAIAEKPPEKTERDAVTVSVAKPRQDNAVRVNEACVFQSADREDVHALVPGVVKGLTVELGRGSRRDRCWPRSTTRR